MLGQRTPRVGRPRPGKIGMPSAPVSDAGGAQGRGKFHHVPVSSPALRDALENAPCERGARAVVSNICSRVGLVPE